MQFDVLMEAFPNTKNAGRVDVLQSKRYALWTKKLKLLLLKKMN